MSKKIFIFISLMFLSNCATSPSALLGPIFTGAKTGSVYQSSLSYTSNKVFNQIKSSNSINKLKKKKLFSKVNPALPDIPLSDKNSVIVLAYKIDKIEYSEIIEPEPLP